MDTRITDLYRVGSAGLLWGTGGLSGAMLTSRSGIDSLAVAGYRLAIGGGVVVAWLVVSGALATVRLTRHGCRRLLIVGILAAWYQTCYFVAVSLTTVGLATLLTLGAAPVLVVAAESVLGRRRPHRRAMLATAAALAGLALLLGGPDGAEPGRTMAGAAFALASAAGFAAITMLGARPVDGLTTLPTIGLAFCAGGLFTLPAAAVTGGIAVVPEFGSVALLVYLGLVPTALAYTLFFTGLRTVPTGTAALLALLEPLTAAVLGVVLLDERLGVLGVTGAVLIGLAVAASSSLTRPGSSRPMPTGDGRGPYRPRRTR